MHSINRSKRTDFIKMPNAVKHFTVIVLTLLICALLVFPISLLKASPEEYEVTIRPVDMSNIQSHVEKLASFCNRTIGYRGADLAAQYIKNEFTSYGLENVTEHTFEAAVPVDHGATLTVLEPKGASPIRVYPMWPNLVSPPQTPPGGITGQLIYVGDGSMEELERLGKPLEGNIVLMDFNSRDNWLNVAKFGAAGVIFVEPEDTNFGEAGSKVLASVAFNFPRVYISRADGATLIDLIKSGRMLNVNLQVNMTWQRVQGVNILGYVKGTEYPDQYVLLTSHYDSISSVPSVSPGAEEAAGISILLDLAEYYAKHPQKYTIFFIAFSGTDLGDVGSRIFFKEKVIDDWNNWGHKVILQWDFGGLTTYTRAITPVTEDGFGGRSQEEVAKWVTRLETYIIDNLRPKIEKALDIPPNSFYQRFPETQGGSLALYRGGFSASTGAYSVNVWYLYETPTMPFDCHALTAMGGPGCAWMSGIACKKYLYTPLDTPDKMNWGNLEYQLKFIYPVLDNILTLEKLQGDYLPSWTPTFGQTQGSVYCDAYTTIAEYNYSTGWYTPVKDAIVAYRGVWIGILGGWSYEMSDEQGKVRMLALQQYYRIGGYQIAVYKVDPENGRVIYAPDYGEHRGPFLATNLYLGLGTEFTARYQPTDLGIFTIFKCGSIVLFDIVDPQINAVPDTRDLFFSVNDIYSHSPVTHQSPDITIQSSTGRGIAMIYVQPNVPIEILLKCTYALRDPLGFLVNASEKEPEGSGYMVSNFGEQLYPGYTPLLISQDMAYTAKARLTLLAAQEARMKELDQYKILVDQAFEALKDNEYAKAQSHSAIAWSKLRKIYLEVRSGTNDVISTLPIFGALLIPFAFLAERLFFNATDRKRISYLLICYAIPLAVLMYYHPSFSIATTPLMVMLGFAVVVLLLPVLLILFSEAGNAIRRQAQVIFGVHVKRLYETIAKSSAVMLTFSISINDMRKRLLRTGLTMFTILIICSSLTMFTSVTAMTRFTTKPTGLPPPYEGFMVQTSAYGRVNDYSLTGPIGGREGPSEVGLRTYEILKQQLGDQAIIVPRAWLLLAGWQRGFEAWTDDFERFGTISGYAGYTPEEAELFPGIQVALARGIWFVKGGNPYSAIISESLSNQTGIDLNDVVRIQGLPFKVIGIVDDEGFSKIRDLNGEMITPLDLRQPGWSVHLSPRETIMIPFETMMELGGWVQTISVKVNSSEIVPTLADDFFSNFSSLIVYAGYEENTHMYTRVNVTTVFGLTTQIPALVMSALIILNLMIARVAERRRDIETYGSVGLSPFHISMFFLTDAMTIAVVGGLLGYLIGITFIFYSPISGIQLNFSSSWVLYAMLISVATCLGSSIYPMLLSSRLVTPSLKRKWEVPPPRGDTWQVPIPIVSTDLSDVKGMLAYLAELLDAHRGEGAEDFRTLSRAYGEKKEANNILRTLGSHVAHSPYEMNIRSNVEITSLEDTETKRHSWFVTLYRETGSSALWETHGRVFIDLMRKQFLMWRGFPPTTWQRYIAMFEEKVVS